MTTIHTKNHDSFSLVYYIYVLKNKRSVIKNNIWHFKSCWVIDENFMNMDWKLSICIMVISFRPSFMHSGQIY